MSIARDVRKSQFAEITQSLPTDYFDIVRSGQNLKILQANLIKDFGAIGTLSTRGEITGIPVLYQVLTDNYIRNIISGSGILASLSPQDGISLAHNFTVDKTGVPVMIDESAASPTIRSLEGGGGINITGVGDYIQIAYGAPASSKTIFVYSMSDFPAAVAGVITLEADTEYRLQNDVTTANRFVLSNNSIISGSDPSLCTLEYTNSGTMITAVDVNSRIKEVTLTASSGTMFDISSSTGAHGFSLLNSIINCVDVGTVDHLAYLLFSRANMFASGNGLMFANNFQAAILTLSTISIPSGTGNGIDLGTATFTYLLGDKLTFNVNTTGYGLSGLASSGNINAGGLGVVTTSRNFGTATGLNNITPYDDLWEFQLNALIPNSESLCLATRASGTVTIATIATPVIVGATWTQRDVHRFTTTAGGRFTYTGRGDLINISISISADIVTAVDNITFFIYLNGSVISGSGKTITLTAGTLTEVTMFWSLHMATNDYLELWVQNNDTTVDVNVNTVHFRAV